MLSCVYVFLICVYLRSISTNDTLVEHNFYWRDYIPGKIPDDAYEAAPGLYIGQVKTKVLMVAIIYPNNGYAVAVDADEALIVEDDIKIFCSPDSSKFYWEYVDLDKPQDKQLQDAVRGAYYKNTHDSLYIGKVMHQDEWKIGKVSSYKHKNNKGIWIWNQQLKPVNIHQFQILKYNITNADVIKEDFYWRDYAHGDIPYDAIEIAPGKYIGQVNFEADTKVATIYSYDEVAAIEVSGRVDVKENIKILSSPDSSRFYWEYVDFTKGNDRQMQYVVKGGYNMLSKAPLFIGKARDDGEWKIGNVASTTDDAKGLWIWDKDNKQLRVYQFYILKYNFAGSISNATAVCTI